MLPFTHRSLKFLLLVLASLTPTVDAADVDYLRDIKPLLKTRCYSCHGAIRQEGNLRLDTVALMLAGGDSGAALHREQGLDSLLLQRITAQDDSERMPPEGEPLSPEQIARVKAWLAGGMKAPADEQPQKNPASHWSLQPLAETDPPAGAHPVDAFIDRKLSAAGLQRAAPANAVALIRRMFLDLHGLPPTPQQVSDWRQRIAPALTTATGRHDTARQAESVNALVDQLLDSPRYGERWAQHWLDVVRYADTHGFEVNTPRPNAWPYRDYVVRAFNDDKPYDRFVFEQLAGDTVGEDAATGFMLAAAALLPGQIGKDEESKRLARQDELDEIIVGTTATFLGLTVGCARCHDHKFDPIPQADYYAMQAFFAGVEYGDREIRGAEFQRRTVQADRLQPQITALRTRLNRLEPKAFTGRTIFIDDEDADRVTLLQTKNGHGTNPEGTQRGYRDDAGDGSRYGNLSGGRYTWWDNHPGQDVFTWNPGTEGIFRLWISWGVHGSGVHTRDARYVLDVDGDLTTTDDQQEVAEADQYYFAGVSAGESEQKPLWSGLMDTGIHEFQPASRIILRGGQTGTGITADVIVLQEISDTGQDVAAVGRTSDSPSNSQLRRPASVLTALPATGTDAKDLPLLPQLRAPVSALKTVERFQPVKARFVRFTSLATIDDNRHEPCLDELEVFTSGDSPINVASAASGTSPTSSGNYSDVGQHQLKHINDGQYGNSRSWISNQHGQGWVQLEFPQPETIDRIEWARDREGKFKDRLPVRYRIETSLDGEYWRVVASSDDRVPLNTPHDDIAALLRSQLTSEAGDVSAMATELQQLEQQQAELRKPQLVFAGRFRQPEPTFVLNRGDPEQPTQEVGPHVLTAIRSLGLPQDSPDVERRKLLAEWIASPDNPLTARVMVNRIWQHHFGTGLVATSSDFGLNGALPSHPELLDWLAREFIDSGWSVKHLHRVIMSSHTYQQASSTASSIGASSTELTSSPERSGEAPVEDPPVQDPSAVDAGNRLLWHFPSRRLEAEAIRDSMLHVSGRLNLKMGGPGFDFFQTRGGLSGFPPIETFTQNELRRMIYAHKIRMEPVPVFGAFDCPDAGLPTPRRSQSTTAIQALNLFNSPFVIDQSEAFAQHIAAEAGPSLRIQADRAFLLAVGRPMSDEEATAVIRTIETQGLATLCRVLFNCSEFLFIP